MLLAELQGKLSSSVTEKEDILTSNAFSFFKYSDRKYLFYYLSELGISIMQKDADDAEFEFWPNYSDGTQPDLVIICGDYYIILEAKLYSDFSERIIDLETKCVEKQLQREARRGNEMALSLGKVPILIAITSEPYQYKEKYAFTKELGIRFIWTNWQFLANFLITLLEKEDENNLYSRDLHDLLAKKNLRSFRTFNQLRAPQALPKSRQIFYNVNTSKFKGLYSGFLSALSKFKPVSNYIPNRMHMFFQFEIHNLIKPTKTIFYHGNNTERQTSSSSAD